MAREVSLVVTVILNNGSTLTEDEVRSEVRNQLMNSDLIQGGCVQLADRVVSQ